MNSIDPETATWYYLKVGYYPQFKLGVKDLDWDARFTLLRDLYDRKDDDKWELRSDDPIADMMAYVAKNGYFTFFVRGIDVFPDGAFRMSSGVCRSLGEWGAVTGMEDGWNDAL